MQFLNHFDRHPGEKKVVKKGKKKNRKLLSNQLKKIEQRDLPKDLKRR